MEKTCAIVSIPENQLMRELGEKACLLDARSVAESIEKLADSGVREFLVAMDDGGGLLAAEAVLKLKKAYPEIRLACLMLWEEQAAHWPESLRNRWFAAFAACDREIILERRRSKDNLQKRNCFLKEYSPSLLVIGGAPAAS